MRRNDTRNKQNVETNRFKVRTSVTVAAVALHKHVPFIRFRKFLAAHEHHCSHRQHNTCDSTRQQYSTVTSDSAGMAEM